MNIRDGKNAHRFRAVAGIGQHDDRSSTVTSIAVAGDFRYSTGRLVFDGFSVNAKVLDTHGKPVPVRDALALINRVLDEMPAEQEGDFDADTCWALARFEQSGFDNGEYGIAETLSKAKNTSAGGLVEVGILASRGGKVRLLKPQEQPDDWDPATNPKLTAWEMVHHLLGNGTKVSLHDFIVRLWKHPHDAAADDRRAGET